MILRRQRENFSAPRRLSVAWPQKIRKIFVLLSPDSIVETTVERVYYVSDFKLPAINQSL